ncbi:MAG: bacterial Ig-like domain-containing protein [Treponema sp.]|nr:bacterial Ig-like domain-containing protein [Treponema sp.]
MKNTFKKFPTMHSIAVIAITAVMPLIAACASMSIESVDWDSLTGPAKVRQYSSVSTTDVTVYANYKDGNRKEVAFFSTSHNKEGTGTQTVTVSVLGQGTGTFQTEVMELTAIRVDRPPSKTTYNVGEKADLSGIKVMGSWRDMPDAEIPANEITVASFNSSTAGTNKLITIKYKEKTATFPVTVTAATATTPSTTQPTQSAAQQPSQQQPEIAEFNPSANPLSPVGTWKRTNTGRDTTGASYTESYTYTFKADGTGTEVYETNRNSTPRTTELTWNVSGNRLTYRTYTDWKYIYSISGNTLTWCREGYHISYTITFIRQ